MVKLIYCSATDIVDFFIVAQRVFNNSYPSVINDKQGSLWCGHLTPVDHKKILYDHVGLIATFPVAVFWWLVVSY